MESSGEERRRLALLREFRDCIRRNARADTALEKALVTEMFGLRFDEWRLKIGGGSRGRSIVGSVLRVGHCGKLSGATFCANLPPSLRERQNDSRYEHNRSNNESAYAAHSDNEQCAFRGSAPPDEPSNLMPPIFHPASLVYLQKGGNL